MHTGEHVKIAVNALGIDQVVEIIACDIDQKVPAQTYTITASDGRSISKDLCEEHAEPFEEWLEEADLEAGEIDLDAHARTVATQVAPEPEPDPEPVPKPRKAAPAKKVAEKKATAPRRRPKVVTLDEIEAQKRG
ncbi:DNA binding protein [Streptomyces phage Triumph]|nr:DNA binding protein [Streptomyces phage Triumph]